jgi:rod shape-determining protein MreC
MEHRTPPFFKTGPAPLVRLTFFVLLSLLLLILDARFHTLEVLREGVATALQPVQSFAGAPAWLIGRVGDFFVAQSALQNENAELKRRELIDAKSLMQADALEAENAHLRELLGARERMPVNAMLAEILYSARDPFSRKVIIDKGLNHGIKAGQPVIDHVGVIGQVTRVHPFISEVTLITDKEQTIPIQVVRNGLRAIAYGGGDGGNLDLRFLPANADVKEGDELVTSGLDGIYLPGLPVAKVTSVQRNAAYARISCTPTAGIDRHAQILVLSSERKVEPAPVEEVSKDKPVKGKRPRAASGN